MSIDDNDFDKYKVDTYKDPDFLHRLINAVKNKKLILFVGAGVSKLCGLPLWRDLAVKMLNICANNEKYCFSHKDKELLISSVSDTRELMTIASNIMSKSNDADFYSTLVENLTIHEENLNAIELNNYRLIPYLIKSFANTIITTNADKIIDDVFDGKSVILYKQMDIPKMVPSKDRKQVFHIHGSINNPSGMIFKTCDYLRRYNDPDFRDRIKDIFNDIDNESVILIIGYSLSELQLLDFIVQYDNFIPIRLEKTFLLNGYYSYQKNVFEAEKEYYSTYGITLLSYNKDVNGYQGLVDALKFIDKEIDKKSEKNMHQIEDICRIFNKEPVDSVFDDFLNCFSELDYKKQNLAFNELLKSPFLYDWINCMLNNEKSNKKYFCLSNNLEKILNEENDFPGCRLLMLVKCSLAKNQKQMKEYFKELISEVLNDDSYFKNKGFCVQLCETILTNIEYISLPISFKFIKKVNETNYSHDWILYLCYKNDILLKVNKKIFCNYTILALKHFFYQNDKYYNFGNFYKIYGQRIRKDAPLEIFKLCSRVINDNYKSYENSFNIRDCFEIISKDANYDVNEMNKVYKILLLYLEGASDRQSIDYYLAFKNSDMLFYKQLSIYLCNIKFGLLRSYFFNVINDYKNDRKFFAEIYSLIKNNIQNINQEEANKILEFIEMVDFNKESEIWSITAKKYLLDLVENRGYFTDEKFLNLKVSVEKRIGEEYFDSIKTMPSPENMSKSMWSSIGGWNRRDEEKKKYNKLSNEEFFKKINQIKSEDDSTLDGVFDSFQERIENHFFLDYLIDNNLIENFTYIVGKIYIDIIADIKNKSYEERIRLIVKAVKINNEPSISNRLREYSFEVLYFLVRNVKEKENSILEELFDYTLSSNYFEENSFWKLEYDFYKNENALLNVAAFVWLNVLIISCQKNQWFKLKEKYIETIKDSNKVVILKSAFASCVHEVWRLDVEFVKENLKSIFDNSIDKTNYSIVAFKLSMFYNSDFIIDLYDKGILISILNDDNFGTLSHYSYIILLLYLRNLLNEQIIQMLLGSNNGAEALVILFRNFEQVFQNGYSSDLVSSLLYLISSNDICGRAELAGIELLELSKIFKSIPYYLNAILKLLSYNNVGVKSDELKDILMQSCLEQKDKELIICTYLEHISNPYLFVEENIDLIDCFDWSCDENKNKIINELSSKNPAYLSLMIKKNKK